MPFLSKVPLAQRHRANFVDQHKKVMSYFPHTEHQDARAHWNILWREENGFILVQSDIPPQGIESVKVDEKLDIVIKKDNFISYKVRMNSVKDLNGKRFRLPKGEIPEWWDKKLQLIGLSTLNNQVEFISENNKVALRQGKKIEAASVVVIGRAQITDEELFRKYFVSGIGRMKAYGFGLISINRYINTL
jgi:CRISPR-associated protein Cas6/Cse3/CasE subtype I-E